MGSLQVVYSDPKTLHQGDIVSFKLPYAQNTKSLSGQLVGVVLSSDGYNISKDGACICPIMFGASSTNEAWGIKLPQKETCGIELLDYEAVYLRPDLASHIGVSYAQAKPLFGREQDRRGRISENYIKEAIAQYIKIISPTSEKLGQRGKGFLAYGEVGYLDFPYGDCHVTESRPVINLTSADYYEVTGQALVAPCRSHIENFHAHHDIAFPSFRWFSEGYFPVTEIRAVSIDRLVRRNDRRPFTIDDSALRGFRKKELGNFDESARQEVLAKYSMPKGVASFRRAIIRDFPGCSRR